ncbi:MAG TPA: hypothetical protein VH417_16160 [Vicinamibacterales bacterium]
MDHGAAGGALTHVIPQAVRSIVAPRRSLRTAAICLTAYTTLSAADFWTAKDYREWSDKEVARMLTDSPWSQHATLSVVDMSLAGRVGGLSGGVLGTGGNTGRTRGGGGVGGDGAGNLGGGSFLPSPQQATVAIRWTSALPVKQALVRSGDAVRERLDESERFYRVAVIGLPLAIAQLGGTMSELLDATALRRRNKPPIGAVDARYDFDRSLVNFEFDFPRDEPLAVGDDEIEFVTSLGQPLKRKFKLRTMMVNGRLEL